MSIRPYRFTATCVAISFEDGLTTATGKPMSRVTAKITTKRGGTAVRTFQIAGEAYTTNKSKIRRGRPVELAFVQKGKFLDCVGLAWTTEQRQAALAARTAANDNAPAAEVAA